MVYQKYKFSRNDKIIAVLLAFIVLLSALGSLHTSCDWGDDFAAYMNEAFAIAEGRFHEQVKLNAFMHPSPVGDNVKDELVYVWGYPLILSAIYKLIGFDTENYSDLIFYKLPSVLYFVITAVFLFLLCRRRGFSAPLCCFSVLAVCSSLFFYDMINSLYSDTVYTGSCVLLLFLIEIYLSQDDPKNIFIFSLVIGSVLWYTYEIRTSGACFLIVLLIGQIINFVGLIKQKNITVHGKHLFLYTLPYILFFMLRYISEHFFLLPASLNSEDVRLAGLDVIYANCLYYIVNLRDFIHDIIFPIFYFFLSPLKHTSYLDAVVTFSYSASAFLAWFSLAMFALGIITDGRRSELHLSVYIVGFAISACLLPYNQGLRYLMSIIPVMLVFVLYGYRRLFAFLKRSLHIRIRKPRKSVAILLCILMSTAVMSGRFKADYANIQSLLANGSDIHRGMEGAYSPDAVEMYTFIKENTDKDDIIAFTKPRALYLNTGRLGFSFLFDNRNILDADYCILTKLFYDHYSNVETPDWFSSFEVVMQNNELFVLKKLT